MKTTAIAPADIEVRSFEIIDEEFENQTGKRKEAFPEREYQVLRRVIHATGDFSLAHHIRFSEDCIDKALDAIRQGKNIMTDVNMLAAGINKSKLSSHGGEVICKVASKDVAKYAKENELTRSEAALKLHCDTSVGIIAIGNAPTALIKTMELIGQQRISPALVIGVPVGFVNAEESKALLYDSSIPHITVLGRRGGSPIAAAIVNALLKMI